MFTQQKVGYYQPKAYIDISRISKIGLVTNLAIKGIIRGVLAEIRIFHG